MGHNRYHIPYTLCCMSHLYGSQYGVRPSHIFQPQLHLQLDAAIGHEWMVNAFTAYCTLRSGSLSIGQVRYRQGPR